MALALASSNLTATQQVSTAGLSPNSFVGSSPTKALLIKCDTSTPLCPPLLHQSATNPEKRAANETTSTKTMKMMTLGTTVSKLGGQGGGASVLERPGLDQALPDTAPRLEEGGEMGKASQKARIGGGDRYRVLLLDHERHTEAQVAKVIPRVVPTVTPDEARKCFFESREFGFGLVTIAVKEHAEFYVQMMTRYGLRSTIEQDSTVA